MNSFFGREDVRGPRAFLSKIIADGGGAPPNGGLPCAPVEGPLVWGLGPENGNSTGNRGIPWGNADKAIVAGRAIVGAGTCKLEPLRADIGVGLFNVAGFVVKSDVEEGGGRGSSVVADSASRAKSNFFFDDDIAVVRSLVGVEVLAAMQAL